MATEFERIARIRRRAASPPGTVRIGIGDDAAVVRPTPGYETVVTADLLVEGVHFQLDWSTPELLGRKALAVSLSDVAAMGAIPRAVFMSLALPERLGDEFLDAFVSGVMALAEKHGAVLAGGDMSASPGPLIIDSVVTGEVETSRALVRSGARAGDLLYVSGRLGSSQAGLRRLLTGMKMETAATGIDLDAIRSHLAPTPRVALGRALVLAGAASAAIDVSDGLSSDLGHLCEMSNVGAVVEAELVPTQFSLEEAIHGGEQYELLFAVPPEFAERVALIAHQLKLELTRIGRFEGPAYARWIESGGMRARLEPRGWDHFRSR